MKVYKYDLILLMIIFKNINLKIYLKWVIASQNLQTLDLKIKTLTIKKVENMTKIIITMKTNDRMYN